jgi:acetyl-CoA carboxylase carboxyl transferase subunit alpha
MMMRSPTAISPEKIQPLDFEKPLIALQKQIETLASAQNNTASVANQLTVLQQQAQALRQQVYGNLLPAQRLQIARHPQRPNALEVIQALSPACWIELHGDRAGADDRAIVGGIIEFEGQPMMVVGTQKGRGMKENFSSFFEI